MQIIRHRPQFKNVDALSVSALTIDNEPVCATIVPTGMITD